jgi:hypothetical protein
MDRMRVGGSRLESSLAIIGHKYSSFSAQIYHVLTQKDRPDTIAD